MNPANTTHVSFKSTAFNTTEERENYVNPECYGDDVCEFLMKGLKELGINCDAEPCGEDWGWCFGLEHEKAAYWVMCGYYPDEERWLVWLERNNGFLKSLVGMGDKKIALELVQKIQQVLSSDSRINNILWQTEKDSRNSTTSGTTGSPTPN